MPRRLTLVLAFVLTAFATIAPAQQPGKVPVIGVLMVSAGPNDPVVEAFRKGLGERGYVEGRNIRIEHRSAQGQIGQLPRLAEELVRLRADIIVSAAEPALA
jgi:putative tryptophan/tyrosine transport system substrate-binding protein